MEEKKNLLLFYETVQTQQTLRTLSSFTRSFTFTTATSGHFLPPPPLHALLLSLLHEPRNAPRLTLSPNIFFLSFLVSFEQWPSSFLAGRLCVSEFHQLSSANKDKGRTAGMWSREVTETRRTNVNPHKVQHNISDCVYLRSSSRRSRLASPRVRLLPTAVKQPDYGIIIFIFVNELFNEILDQFIALVSSTRRFCIC